MKKLITLICSLLLLQMISSAQNNPGFNYQAVARDANGQVIENGQLALRFSIILDNLGNGNGSIIYREKHLLTTNEYGLFSTIVGQGDSLLGNFQNIDWAQMNLFLKVDLDLELDQTYTFIGKTRILPVPVALHAMSADDVDDADADPTNELQFLQYDSLTNTLQLTGANSIQLPLNATGTDADADPQNEIQVLSKNGINVTLSAGGGTISVADNDNNPNNELQALSRVGNQITLSNGGGSFIDQTQDADADASNEIQVIGFDASTAVLSLSNGGGQVDLSALRSNLTDDQQLSLNGTILSIEDGNSIDLANLPQNNGDADPQNELQQLTFDTSTYILSLSDGGQVNLSALKGFNTMQSLRLNGTALEISGGNTIDLSSLPDQTEDADADPTNEIQAISFDTATNVLTLSNGGTVDLTSLKSASNNGILQNLSLNGTSLSISGGNQIDLSNLPDQTEDADADPTNEIQAISFDAATKLLTLSNGGTVDLSQLSDGVNDADADPMNEIQAISFDAATKLLTLSNGGTVDLSQLSDGVNDADADPMNEIQAISFDAATKLLTLSNGGTVDLSQLSDGVNDADADPTNEIQAISFDAATKLLTLSNGGTVDLSQLSDGVNDADADPTNEIQAISFDAATKLLTLSNGGTVDLSQLSDGVNDADADPQNELQQLSLEGMVLSIDQGNSIDLNVLDKEDADADPTNELQYITFDSTSNLLMLSTHGGTVDLSSLAGNSPTNPAQTLNLNGKFLEISDGNSVDLAPLSSPWERQAGFIQYDRGDVKVDNIYAEQGDSSSQMFAGGLSVVDAQKFADLGINALQFDYIQGSGDHAYYGRDSLSFGLNVATLLPVFSEMDALGAEFYNFQSRTYHAAGTSEYNFGQDSLDITAFGLVSRGNSGNTPYERFRLEANNFTMYNNQRFKSYEFITPDAALAAQFKMYPGTGIPAYFELGPDPFDPLNPQLSLSYNGNLAAQLTTEVGGYGRLNLFDPINFGAAEMSALNGIYYQDGQGYGFSMGPTGTSQRQELLINNGDVVIYDSLSNKRWQWSPERLDVLTPTKGELAFTIGISELDRTNMSLLNGDFTIYSDNYDLTSNALVVPVTEITSDAKIRLYHPINYSFGSEMTHNSFKIFTANDTRGTIPSILLTEESGKPFVQLYNPNTDLPTARLGGQSTEGGSLTLWGDDGRVAFNQYITANLAAQQETYGPNRSLNTVVGANGDFPNRGGIGVYDENSSLKAGMYVDEFGLGVLFADTKNFRVDHPEDETKEIWYVSLEGPEAAAYERGTSTLENGEIFIPFPEHFRLIANTNTATIQLTPLSAESMGLAVVKKTAEGFYVKELFKGSGTYEFDWEVKCVRQGYENFEVIREKKN